jgi:hypothetical protein
MRVLERRKIIKGKGTIFVETVLVAAALDRKGAEVSFCRGQTEALGANTLIMDGDV